MDVYRCQTRLTGSSPCRSYSLALTQRCRMSSCSIVLPSSSTAGSTCRGHALNPRPACRQLLPAPRASHVDPHLLVSALAEAAQDGAALSADRLSAAAWAVVVGALCTSIWFMVRAYQEAKTAIDRREEGERAKKQEDEQKEEARKAKIKQMFERL